MSPKMYSNYSRYIIYILSYSIIITHHHIHATLTLDDAETWSDDFTEDPTGDNGWSIQKLSEYESYDLPDGITNPMVTISSTPAYHGPFPASYTMQRSLTCNTVGDTQLYISMLASYCNTDKGFDDCIQLSITDPSGTSTLDTFDPFKLNHKEKPLSTHDLPFVQETTANYYTNHPSSTTTNPQCSDPASYDTTTTPAATATESHLIPGRWYTHNTHQTYDLTVSGGHTYDINIEMQMSGDPDEYVIISHIYAQCIQLTSPTVKPTVNPTVPTSTPSVFPTNIPTTSTTIPPSYAAISPTTERPTISPSETTTTEAMADTILSTMDIETTDIEQTASVSTVDTTVPLTKYTSTTTETESTNTEQYTSVIATESFTTEEERKKVQQKAYDTGWCQHCAIYVLLGCVVLVICFMILMGIACIMYKKEDNKLKQRRHRKHFHINNPVKEQEPYEVTVVDIDEDDVPSSINDENDHVVPVDPINIGSIQSSPNINRVDVMSDMGIITYDEMNEHEAQHPAHKKTMSAKREDGSNNSSSLSLSETESIDPIAIGIDNINIDSIDIDGIDIDGIDIDEGESKEDPDLDDIGYIEQGIDGMSDDGDETNPVMMNLVDNSSYDHLNMDEDGILDESDSRY